MTRFVRRALPLSVAALGASFLIVLLCTAQTPAVQRVGPAASQGKLGNMDWPFYRGDQKGNQFVALAQINATNVHRLKPAWEYHTGDATERSTMYANPLVVNGLQTSYEIFNHFSAGASRDDKRTLLVRVIVIDAESATSDKIITATNSQTKIEAINLHATEQIQRHIEMALKAHDLYYDRRKNYYRNQGISIQKIVKFGTTIGANLTVHSSRSTWGPWRDGTNQSLSL